MVYFIIFLIFINDSQLLKIRLNYIYIYDKIDLIIN